MKTVFTTALESFIEKVLLHIVDCLVTCFHSVRKFYVEWRQLPNVPLLENSNSMTVRLLNTSSGLLKAVFYCSETESLECYMKTVFTTALESFTALCRLFHSVKRSYSKYYRGECFIKPG